MRVAIGGLHTECSTYNPLFQVEDDFTHFEGNAVLQSLDIVVPKGLCGIGISYYRSVPGGAVSAATYKAFKYRFLEGLKGALPLDAVYLSMHGAVHVEGLNDAEGDWIGAVRSVIGDDALLAVSYDLHGNVTQDIIDQIDIFTAYRTAPHIDVVQTRNRALCICASALIEGIKPLVSWCPVPVLMTGECSSTEDSPAKEIYDILPLEDAKAGVLDANLLVGYVWADTPRATACAVVTGFDAQVAQQSAARLAQAYWDVREEFDFGVETGRLDECLERISKLEAAGINGPIILADSGDNPTGGGVGDRADVLEALLARGMQGAVIAGIADAPAAFAAYKAGKGACVQLNIGATLGHAGPVVTAACKVICVLGSINTGDVEALVDISGLLVILTSRRRPFHNLVDFRKFNIEPANQTLIVVKSGYLSPELAPLASPALMALTDGAVNQGIKRLENLQRAHPMYPFQTDFVWLPKPSLSKRVVYEVGAR